METTVDLTLTVVVLSILTAVIFAFAIVAFLSIYRNEKTFVGMGQRDNEIKEEQAASQKTSYKVTNIVTSVFSYLVIAASLGVMVFSLYSQSKDQMLWNSNGEASMVIASSSMSGVHDAKTQTYITSDRKNLEFNRGDIITIKSLPSVDELLPDTKTDEGGKVTYVSESDLAIDGVTTYVNDYLYNSVFVYYNSDLKLNVVHRLVFIGFKDPADKSTVVFGFRGDNNSTWDGSYVDYSQLKALYTEPKTVKGIGYAVLFFQSGFGIYSVITSIVMIVSSSIFISKIEKSRKERLHLIEAVEDAAKPDEIPGVNDPDEIPEQKKSTMKEEDFKELQKEPTKTDEASDPINPQPIVSEPSNATAEAERPAAKPAETPAMAETTVSGATAPEAVKETPNDVLAKEDDSNLASSETPDPVSKGLYVKIMKSEGGKR